MAKDFQGHDAAISQQTGRPTPETVRWGKSVDKSLRDFSVDLSGKADIATTLAGYGITDAEQLGIIRGFNVQTGDYTVLQSDAGQVIYMNSASPQTLTLPAGLTSGTYVQIIQAGAGQVTIGGGVTLSYNSGLKTAGQWAFATAVTSNTNWFAGGNLVP